MIRASRLLPAVALVAGLAAVSVPSSGPAHASLSCPALGTTQLTQSQSVTPAGGAAFIVCTGRVRTFDGTPLQVDVTVPSAQYVPEGSKKPATPPLMLLMSGYSNDVCQFESTTLEGAAVPGCGDWIGNNGYHWNNAWFASEGIPTVTYTPRGWYGSCGTDLANKYDHLLDPTCTDTPGEQSWIHLYDRRFEIRDAQLLAGMAVDAGLADPNQIVASGDSGGGGPSWDLALSQDQVVQLSSTPSNVVTAPWTSPKGTPLHLAAALPMYTWTDLLDALVSNGSASDGLSGAPPDGNHTSPAGVEKASYVLGFFLKGIANVPSVDQGAQYALPGVDPTADLTTWFTEINAGEPLFGLNPQTKYILDQIGGQLRSALVMPVPPNAAEVPIFVIQGLTDPLFPALQAQTMINRLKAVDPHYPVTAFYGDVGHAYASNPSDVWQQAHDEGNDWLSAVLAHDTPTQPAMTVDTTRCVGGQTLQSYSGDSLGAIETSAATFTSAGSQTIVHVLPTAPPLGTYEGVETDPIVTTVIGGTCRSIMASLSDMAPFQASYSFPISTPITMVGGPTVNVTASLLGSDAIIAARLWDVDSAGTQTLITRAETRIVNPSILPFVTNVHLELWPNAWQLQAGHTLKLELTQDDFPTWRPDNEPASITLSNLSLTVPTH
ncbi:MAG: CocE/NonD family hydrolase C-terminal non-catalytic domain-containing protein [Candidatus Dormibacteria bacterium]